MKNKAVCKCDELQNPNLRWLGVIIDIHNMECPVFKEREERNAALLVETIRGWTIEEKTWRDAALDEFRTKREK